MISVVKWQRRSAIRFRDFAWKVDFDLSHITVLITINVNSNLDDIYLLDVNNVNTKTICKIYSKSIIKILERRHWLRSGIFIVNFEHILHIALLFHCWLWTNKCWLPGGFNKNVILHKCLLSNLLNGRISCELVLYLFWCWSCRPLKFISNDITTFPKFLYTFLSHINSINAKVAII